MNELLKKLMQKYKNLEHNYPNMPLKVVQTDIIKEIKVGIKNHQIKGVDIKRASTFILKIKKCKKVSDIILEIGNNFLTP